MTGKPNQKTSHGKPNFTAWFVMQGVLVAMRHPQFAKARDEAALALYEVLAKSASRTRLLSQIIYKLPYALQYRIGELVTTPGRLRHYLLRKQGIERHMRALLQDGECSQVVILGAGLDVLGIRLANDYPHIHFIEIDMAESQSFKRASLDAASVHIPHNLEFIAGDLRDPLSGILAGSARHRKDAPTLWLAEGLFMFIPESGVRKIFGEMKECSAGPACIFTTLPCKEQGGAFARNLQKFYLKKEDSQLNWSIDFPDVQPFMQSLGYEMIWQVDYDWLHKEYSSRSMLGENLHMVRLIKAESSV